MLYVIGDIHGQKDKYFDMLDQINPGEKDAVFILDDVIDIGEEGIAILQDMMYRPNIYPILGDHEYYARKAMAAMADCHSLDEAKATLEGEAKHCLDQWLSMGGEKTAEDFLALDSEGRESILDYLGEFQSYELLEAGGKTFLLAHGGVGNPNPDKDFDDYADEDFALTTADYNKVYFKDKYLVTGHTPTAAISPAYAGKVYSKKGHIDLDCGAAYGGRLAALCLDTLKLIYC